MAEGAQAVLLGAAQVEAREDDPRAAPQPLDLLERVAREAAEDAGAGARLLAAVDTLGVVGSLGWRPKNAARLVAGRLGIRPAREIVTALGGESPLVLLNHAARLVRAGDARVVLIAGTNNLRSQLRARRQGVELAWELGGDGDPETLTHYRAGHSEREARYEIALPTRIYPLFENALRARRGLDLETHRARMGALFAGFSAVAARNPHAWFPVARSARELTTPSAENRMISFPYTKWLNAVLEVDQAAAVVLASEDAARELGLRAGAFWWGGGGAVEEPWFATERPDLAACPALAAAARGALAEAGLALDEIAAFDLYSCFPVAVEMACEMLGIGEDDPRGLTLTGGLPYAGGPGNDYCLHAVATALAQLRAGLAGPVLLTGLGWYLTKHAASVLGPGPCAVRRAEPGAAEPGAAVHAAPVEIADVAEGAARIETYTVVHDRVGAPERGIVVGRLGDGRRFLADTPGDRALLEDLLAREAVGRAGRVAPHDGRNRFTPD